MSDNRTVYAVIATMDAGSPATREQWVADGGDAITVFLTHEMAQEAAHDHIDRPGVRQVRVVPLRFATIPEHFARVKGQRGVVCVHAVSEGERDGMKRELSLVTQVTGSLVSGKRGYALVYPLITDEHAAITGGIEAVLNDE